MNRNGAIETLVQTLADTRNQLGSQKALFCKSERAFDKQKQNYEKKLKSLDEKFRQKRVDERNLANMKNTISELREQVDLLNMDQNSLPIFHLLHFYLTYPDIIYMDKSYTSKLPL